MTKIVTPYEDAGRSKKEQVTEMFDNIAPSYDFLNHALSLGIDIRWRRKAVRMLGKYNPQSLLDIATGTGDFAVDASRAGIAMVTGLDISAGMLEVARKKLERKGLADKITLLQGDCEDLPFKDDSFDAVTVGFGVRNFEDLHKGLSEILRVLKPGHAAAILEPSVPSKFPMKQLFGLYFRRILPFAGRIFSKDRRAYTYLPESVRAFPNGKEFVEICEEVGFRKCNHQPLTFGICSLYLVEK